MAKPTCFQLSFHVSLLLSLLNAKDSIANTAFTLVHNVHHLYPGDLCALLSRTWSILVAFLQNLSIRQWDSPIHTAKSIIQDLISCLCFRNTLSSGLHMQPCFTEIIWYTAAKIILPSPLLDPVLTMTPLLAALQ